MLSIQCTISRFLSAVSHQDPRFLQNSVGSAIRINTHTQSSFLSTNKETKQSAEFDKQQQEIGGKEQKEHESNYKTSTIADESNTQIRNWIRNKHKANFLLPPLTLADFPEINAQLHPVFNGEVDPSRVYAFEKKNYWFKCDQGPDHEWNAELYRRTRKGALCPFCTQRKLSVTNSLATRFPETAKKWHPTLNDISPNDIMFGARAICWFQCQEHSDHVYRARLDTHTHTGVTCGFCNKTKKADPHNIAKLLPQLVKEWNPHLNISSPTQFSITSEREVWWRCRHNKQHMWKEKISDRCKHLPTCPDCVIMFGKKLTLDNIAPMLSDLFHPTKNGDLKLSDLTRQSKESVWWIKNPVYVFAKVR